MPRATAREATPTLKDVAAAAGVSRATAGRALAGYGNVRADLVAKIRASADSLGYRPDELARSMREKRTRTIGVICGDIENLFFSRLVRGITDAANQQNVEVIVTNTDEDQSREKKRMDVLIGKRVDGVIVYPAQGPDRVHYEHLQRRGIPLVFVDHALQDIHADAVMVDGARAAEEAVTYLIELGHRDIALVSEATDALATSLLASPDALLTIDTRLLRQSGARLVGYLRALQQAGIPAQPENILSSSGYSSERAYLAVLSRFSSERPTALFSTDNAMTVGAFRALRALGVSIPDEVSLMGFDDVEWTRLVSPELTVVSQPVLEMGRLAASELLRRIDSPGEEPRTTYAETQIVERASTAPPLALRNVS